MRTFLLEIPPGYIPFAAFLSIREVKSSAYFRNKPENLDNKVSAILRLFQNSLRVSQSPRTKFRTMRF